MREIKFRAWELYGHGQWVFGYLSRKWDNWFITDDNGSATLIDINSIGQLTGLKDKNGREIYEGDIATGELGANNQKYIGVCEFSKKMGGFIFGNKKTNSYSRSTVTVGRLKRIEVIGNIYENPELLGDAN